MFKLARSFGHAAKALQFGFDGTSVGEAGAFVGGTAHEQMALTGSGKRDFLRAQEWMRVA
ncbi:hypothetical protein GCM10011383_24520 [Hymenobacter cavernae]|uniref:Uncharacterized protein n=1 Tax=Hymenobacter cavernae TaxID=2044852 RepID=A0ABQ1U7Y8_9BACT|nr:hypothetical protein GCM10011383_24520 [Hymenobacter cavernae]